MPRKASGNFNQTDYVNQWAKENMKGVSASFKKEFVEEFKEAIKINNIKMSDVIRNAMIEQIEIAKKNKPL